MWVEYNDQLVDEAWPDHPDFEPEMRGFLQASYEQCLAFAPTLADGAPVPYRYKLAQVLQARALHRSGIASSGDNVGGEQGVTVFPMDWTVKNLLRPRTGRPVIV